MANGINVDWLPGYDRPHDKRGHGVSEDLRFPDDVCPLQCDDPWYSKYPEDDFFCAKGESNNG